VEVSIEHGKAGNPPRRALKASFYRRRWFVVPVSQSSAEEVFDQRRHSLRLIMVKHVTGIMD
jgi:hypothetical protein